MEMLVDPRVHGRPADVVVVVLELQQRMVPHVLLRAEQPVVLLQLRETLGGHFLGPVVGRQQAQRFGGEHRRELDVAGRHPQQARVFARAAALHGGRDHHGRNGNRDAGIEGAENERLRAAAAGARDRDPLRVHVRQAQEEIHGPEGIIGLHPHDRLQTRFRRGTEQPPILGRAHLRPLLGESVRQALRNLHAVGIADHVVVKHDAAHPGQLHAAGLQRAAAAVLETLRPFLDLLLHAVDAHVIEAAVGPVSVRAEHARQLARLALGPIQVARDEEAGKALEVDFLDRVIALVAAAMNHRIQGRLGRHRPQAQRNQHLPPHLFRPPVPFLPRFCRSEREVAVQVLQLLQTLVGRQFVRRQHAHAPSGGQRRPSRQQHAQTG